MAKIGSIGKRQNLLIRQGATFGPVEVPPLIEPDGTITDVSESTFRAQMRRTALDAEVVAEFDTVVVGSDTVSFTYGLSAAATAAIPAGERPTDKASQYVWDLEREDSGRVTPIYYGSVTVFREVTRD